MNKRELYALAYKAFNKKYPHRSFYEFGASDELYEKYLVRREEVRHHWIEGYMEAYLDLKIRQMKQETTFSTLGLNHTLTILDEG